MFRHCVLPRDIDLISSTPHFFLPPPTTRYVFDTAIQRFEPMLPDPHVKRGQAAAEPPGAERPAGRERAADTATAGPAERRKTTAAGGTTTAAASPADNQLHLKQQTN